MAGPDREQPTGASRGEANGYGAAPRWAPVRGHPRAGCGAFRDWSGREGIVRTIASVILGFTLLQAAPKAQLGYLWSFDERTSRSDLVVIAVWAVTRDTERRATITELRPPFPVVELNTEFKIQSVLKGTPPGKTLTLRHYRHDTDQLRGGVVNGPYPLDFTMSGSVIEYLLFLKRDVDGIFVPISGQVFPEDSVFTLHEGTR